MRLKSRDCRNSARIIYAMLQPRRVAKPKLIMLSESSVSLFTGTFPGLHNCRGGQVVLLNVFFLLVKAHVPYF